MGNMLGKRYICGSCGTEALCNKPGDGSIQCCGSIIRLRAACEANTTSAMAHGRTHGMPIDHTLQRQMKRCSRRVTAIMMAMVIGIA